MLNSLGATSLLSIFGHKAWISRSPARLNWKTLPKTTAPTTPLENVTYYIDVQTQCYAPDVTSQVRCLWMDYYRCINVVTMTILTWYIRWCLYRSFEWGCFRDSGTTLCSCQIVKFIIIDESTCHVQGFLYRGTCPTICTKKHGAGCKVIKFPAEGRRLTSVDPMTSWFWTKSSVKIVLCGIKVLPDSLQFSHSNVQDMADLVVLVV